MKFRMLILASVVILCTMVGCTRQEKTNGLTEKITVPAETETTIYTAPLTETEPSPSVREEEMDGEESEESVEENNLTEKSVSETEAKHSQKQETVESVETHEPLEDSEPTVLPGDAQIVMPSGNGPNDTPDQEL